MNIKEYIELDEDYQNLYCYKSMHRTLDILKKGFIEISQYEVSDSEHHAVKKPHICVTRNSKYKSQNDETAVNIGSIQELPGSFAAAFVLDTNKIRTKYKIVPFKNPRFKESNMEDRLRNRYEAEERIMTSHLPLSYVKEIVISNRTSYLNKFEIEKMAKEKNIKVRVDTI